MANKKEPHTTIRNNALFCTHCGEKMAIPFPMGVQKFSEMCKGFEIMHKNCEKTWTKPMASPKIENTPEDILYNVEWWKANGEHGISAETIVKYLGIKNKLSFYAKSEGYPHDPDDFRRCYELLEAVPQFKTQIKSMAWASPAWAALVTKWDVLTELFEDLVKTGKDNGMYKLMQDLTK